MLKKFEQYRKTLKRRHIYGHPLSVVAAPHNVEGLKRSGHAWQRLSLRSPPNSVASSQRSTLWSGMSRTAWTDSTQRVAPILLRHGVAGFIPPCLPSPAERPPSGPCCESGRTYSKRALQSLPAAVEQLVYILAPPSDLPLAAIMAHCIPMSASAICSRTTS